ncbi:MAG: hypothetical protein QXM86_02690 [Candidatus Bathyarchaeia archaeon]
MTVKVPLNDKRVQALLSKFMSGKFEEILGAKLYGINLIEAKTPNEAPRKIKEIKTNLQETVSTCLHLTKEQKTRYMATGHGIWKQG